MTQANYVDIHHKSQSVRAVQIKAKTTKAFLAFLMVWKLLCPAENNLLVGAYNGVLGVEGGDPALALRPMEKGQISRSYSCAYKSSSGSVTTKDLTDFVKAPVASVAEEVL